MNVSLADRRIDRRCLGDELPAPQSGWVEATPGDFARDVLQNQLHWICELPSCIAASHLDRVHSPYGWTIRQVFEHCVDTERFLAAAITRTAAGESVAFPGWDHEAYAAARFGLGNMRDLVSELGYLRLATIHHLRRLRPPAWNRTATFFDQPISVRGLAWTAAGHLNHHFEIIEARCRVTADRCPPT